MVFVMLFFILVMLVVIIVGVIQLVVFIFIVIIISIGFSFFVLIVIVLILFVIIGFFFCIFVIIVGVFIVGIQGFSLKVFGVVFGIFIIIFIVVIVIVIIISSSSIIGFVLNLKLLVLVGIFSNIVVVVIVLFGFGVVVGVVVSFVMIYVQLESLINKWSLELEDQEWYFFQQVIQVNVWDCMLIENGEKIISLYCEVEKVKLDQKRLDQEFDFILFQQKELEDLLSLLEELVKEQSGIIYLQYVDEECEKIYKLVENIDVQFKCMVQDFKDIIEYLNMFGVFVDISDLLQQICKIFNVYMDLLQWIDQNLVLLQRKVEEVIKVCEGWCKEQECSFWIIFD